MRSGRAISSTFWPQRVCVVVALLGTMLVSGSCESPEPDEAPPERPAAPATRTPPGSPSGSATVTPSLEELDSSVMRSPEAVAMAYCRFTQGPVPHWLLYEVFDEIVVPAEREHLRTIGEESETAMRRDLPRQRAVMRFLARNTRCSVRSKIERPSGEVWVLLDQRIPLMEEPNTTITTDPSESAAFEDAWLEALQQAFEGVYRDAPLRLVTRKNGDEWRVDPDLGSRFIEPRKTDRGLTRASEALRERDWDTARELAEELCGGDARDERCEHVATVLERAATHMTAIQPVIEKVKLGDPTVKGVIIGETKAVPVLKVQVTNDSRAALEGVWVLVTGARDNTRVCRLTQDPPGHRTPPLRVPPGSTKTGACRLTPGVATPIEVTLRDVVAPSVSPDPNPAAMADDEPIPH